MVIFDGVSCFVQFMRLELRGGEVRAAAQAATYEAQTLAQTIISRVRALESSKVGD